MLNNTLRSGVLIAAFAALSTGAASAGCAKHNQPPTTAQRAKSAHGEIKDDERLTATVDGIDQANKTIILHDDQGRKFAMDADQSALQKLKVNDQIKVVYQEALAFALEDPAKQHGPDETKVEESAEKTKDNEIQVGRKITTTVQILSVAPKGTAVEFRLPEGPVRTIAIDDVKNQKQIQNLRPGDSVRVTFTEKLRMAVDETNAT